ncbi:MAG: NAD(P)H nitroreductase [Desulfobulbaceae bacterium]|nr:MAG: NAD(P)H nitroreductase [Desulfobulbaceae bacterium]
MPVPFAELIQARQSVREYRDLPVADRDLQQLIEAVRLAPSASNSQPWRLIIVNDPEKKNRIARATFSALVSFNRFAVQAPVIAVLTIERPKIVTQIGARLKDREFSLIDIGIAAEHFCLQAAELGLGTCMIGWFDEEEVRRVLHIPAKTRIGLLITLGHPPEGYPLRPKTRKKVRDMCGLNTY